MFPKIHYLGGKTGSLKGYTDYLNDKEFLYFNDKEFLYFVTEIKHY